MIRVRFLFSQEFCNIDVIIICKFDSKIIRSDGEEDNLALNDVVFTIEEKGPSSLQKNTQLPIPIFGTLTTLISIQLQLL